MPNVLVRLVNYPNSNRRATREAQQIEASCVHELPMQSVVQF